MAAQSGTISIKIVGDTRGVDYLLQRLETRLAPPGITTWLATEVDPIIRQRARDRFASEGDDVTGQWQPLKPFTVQARIQAGYGGDHPINERTGQLKDYVVDSSHSVTMLPGGGLLDSPDPANATGSLVDKLEAAQQGLPFPATPARPVMGLGIVDLDLILLSLAYFIQRP